MDAHPDYSICFHACEVYDVRTQHLYYEAHKTPQGIKSGGADVSSDMFLRRQFGTQPLTMLMRVSMYDLSWFDIYHGYRDTHEVYLLLRKGKGYFMDFVGGVYIKHNGGISTSVTIDRSKDDARLCYTELYLVNRQDKVLRDKLVDVLLWNYDIYKMERKRNEFHRVMCGYWTRTPHVALNVYRKIIIRNIKSLV